ncbi:MAG: zinc ribbon domain-containing protein [Candidatus Helarchaeota archaeon]|nr:zinc ribbon domain-containing protein [Candidatus Helarchaeota archaeon]
MNEMNLQYYRRRWRYRRYGGWRGGIGFTIFIITSIIWVVWSAARDRDTAITLTIIFIIILVAVIVIGIIIAIVVKRRKSVEGDIAPAAPAPEMREQPPAAPPMKYCIQCGKQIKADDKFCLDCGATQNP